MANETGFHLSNIQNGDLYELQRSNNFEFVVPGLTTLLRAGYTEEESGNSIDNVGEVLRLSVLEASVPSFTQQVIEIRRGNAVMKAAGLPTFEAGSLIIHDFIGADGKSALAAWQNLSYNSKTHKIGTMAQYKKDCYLQEYTPDFRLVRTWELKGCWISGLTMPPFNQESGDKRQVTATIQYDLAYMRMPEDE